MKTETSDIRIYVACLAAYNNGKLHGEWIDATKGSKAVKKAIAKMLKNSPEPGAEEYAIHDFEGFGDVKLSEYEDIDDVCELADAIEEHGELFAALYASLGGDDIGYAKKVMTDGYLGEHKSLEDYAYSTCEECYSDSLGNLPDFIKGWIDWEGVGRDMELSGDIFTIEHDGMTHVFDNHV